MTNITFPIIFQLTLRSTTRKIIVFMGLGGCVSFSPRAGEEANPGSVLRMSDGSDVEVVEDFGTIRAMLHAKLTRIGADAYIAEPSVRDQQPLSGIEL